MRVRVRLPHLPQGTGVGFSFLFFSFLPLGRKKMKLQEAWAAHGYHVAIYVRNSEPLGPSSFLFFFFLNGGRISNFSPDKELVPSEAVHLI